MSVFLVVVTVIWNAETRSLDKKVVEGAGHRDVESRGYLRALCILINGLGPDESAYPFETPRLRSLLKSAPSEKTSVALGTGEQPLRAEAAELAIKHHSPIGTILALFTPFGCRNRLKGQTLES